MITINATLSQMIKIGHQGENKAVQVTFDLTPFQAAFQGGYPQLVVRRPGDQSGYPVALLVDGSKAIWIVSDSDTEKAGHGQCELQWFVGDTLAKSDKYNFLIYSSIPGDAEPPDVPSKAWFEKILSDIGDLSDLDTEAKENLVAAINEVFQTGGGGAGGTNDHSKLINRDAADQHPIAAITGLEAALDGKQPTGNYLTNEALAGAVDDALAQAKASGEFDGAPGKDGADGLPGADGYSPSAKVTQTASGAEITITDKDGTTTATVANGKDGAAGKDGADGVGIESVVQTTTSNEDGGTNVVTVTKTDGSSSTFTVKNGSKGSDGAPGTDGAPGVDGHTPVKGTDYWTQDDQNAIVADVLAALPTWEGGSY